MLTRSRAQLEDGYSLIEMLAAMVCSAFVIAALATIMVVTLHSSTRTLTRVDATQRARVTMEQILNELHSSCLSYGATPIQAGSSNTSLSFDYEYGSAVTPTAVQHTIAFNAAAGTLVDTSTAYAGGSKILLSNVSQSGTTPVFQYYAYAAPTNPATGSAYTDSAGNSYMMLLDGTTAVPGTSTIPPAQPLAVPLSASGSATAVEVVMTLLVGPYATVGENTHEGDASTSVADSSVLRLTPAANHAGGSASFVPCQ
jgi:type II secretory pathway pseudopilin PulG